VACPELTVRTVQDVAVAEIHVASITTYKQIEPIKSGLYGAIDRGATRKIVVDFSAVEFLTTEAIGMLLKLKAKTESLGGRLALSGLRDHPREAFEFLHLHKAFEVYPTQAEALAALAAGRPHGEAGPCPGETGGR